MNLRSTISAHAALTLAVGLLASGCHLIYPFGLSSEDTATKTWSDGPSMVPDGPPLDTSWPGEADLADLADLTNLEHGPDTAEHDGTSKVVTLTNALSGPSVTSGMWMEVSTEFWAGWRFQVPAGTSFMATKVGLHVRASGTELGIFGSLVKLTDASDLPDKLDLSGADVVQTTLITMQPAAAGSQNVSGAVSAALVPGGWYAVFFGAGLLGTTGKGLMPGNNSPLPLVQDPITIKQSTKEPGTTGLKLRFFVEGILK